MTVICKLRLRIHSDSYIYYQGRWFQYGRLH